MADLIDWITQGIDSIFGTQLSPNTVDRAVANQNLSYQKESRDINLSLQREQWQREDTAMQRAVQDAQNAGINPLWIYGSSAPSSSPVNIPPLEDKYSQASGSVVSALATAFGLANQSEQITNLKADSAVKNATAGRIDVDIQREKATTAKYYLDILQNIEDYLKAGRSNPTTLQKVFSLGIFSGLDNPNYESAVNRINEIRTKILNYISEDINNFGLMDDSNASFDYSQSIRDSRNKTGVLEWLDNAVRAPFKAVGL